MPDDWRTHVVQQGEHLSDLAARFGFDANAVWQDARNDDLRSRRDNPLTLAPGDILHIPIVDPEALSLVPKTTNRYEATIPTVSIDVVFGDAADQPYVVEGLAEPIEGTADGDGRIQLEVPITARELSLELPRLCRQHPIRIGHLDPIEESSGVRQRLQHLGFFGAFPTSTGALPNQAELDRQAIASFQRAHDLPETGTLDPDTRDRLLDEHGG